MKRVVATAMMVVLSEFGVILSNNVLAQEAAPEGKSQKEAVGEKVIVWDSGRSYKGDEGEFAALKDKSNWARVPVDASVDYRFTGDCVVENEHLWLYLPSGEAGTASLWGKSDGEVLHGIALYEYDEEGQRLSGQKSIRISRNANHEAIVEYGTKTPQGTAAKIAYRVPSGKRWIEAKPVENAGRLGIGIKSQLVIVPSEFGEDFICNSLKQKAGSTLSFPRDNLVIALNCDGNFMSVLTYPSTDQAGDILIGRDQAVTNHGQRVSPSITAVNASFKGRSIFVGLLDHRENWYYERINKIYSASGQYVSDWNPPYAGTWRLVGRVGGRYRVNDVSGGHFIFGCSWSGTFEYLSMYMYARTKDTRADVVTPLDVYRETLGEGPNAYLLETEGRRDVYREAPRTKHRDVCGTVNDLKDTWKDHLDRIEDDQNYISGLTGDAKAIMGRLESRLNEYRGFAGAVARVCEEMKERQGSAEYEWFTGEVRRHCDQLEKVKGTRYLYGCRVADEIERVFRDQPERLRNDRTHLDKLAEEVRDVAQLQEDNLKEYRKITTRISNLCQERREAKKELSRCVIVIGRLCRQILRNRDPEE